MKKSKWRGLIRDIYQQEIATKLHRIRRHLEPFEFKYRNNDLYEASRTIRYVEQLGGEDFIVTEAVSRRHLREAVQDLLYAHRRVNERLLLETGIIESLEVHMLEILSELEVSDLPREDIEALRHAGSVNPKGELRLRIRRIQSHYQMTARKFDNQTLTSSVHEASQHLDRKIQELKEPEQSKLPHSEKTPEERIKLKWFKGLGSLCRGTVLTAVDVSLLAGSWDLPLSPDTTVIGSVASIVTGLGDIAIGVGEFRGE
ncbi:MAG: hypothetical protein KIH69_017300 [Anaerolineae bacterium]|nr:hypothetical protein [Anaerolineae bacterium]